MQNTAPVPTTTTASKMQPFNNSLFGSFDDPILNARAAQVALADIDVKNVPQLTNPLMRPHDMFSYSNYFSGIHDTSAATNIYQGLPSSSEPFDASVVVPTSSDDQMTPLQQVMAMQQSYGAPPPFQYNMTHPFSTTSIASSNNLARYPIAPPTSDMDTDPRQLETFAEHFKQRRIKLGVTQADVGKALAHLKMPGVGSLSQSTICRFESLTLSHNNMVALKPILHSWLEKAEEAMKQKDTIGDINGILPNTDKKRKRTSIAAPEKRELEQFFKQQPRPSGERIASIADRLDLKKNVVRVWFCNQRQKQKRDFRSQFRARSAAAVMGPRVMPVLNGNNSNNNLKQGQTTYNGLPGFFD
ncbi:Transcription factor unc-86 [Caenorhabditis elegans]|uniref:Transcription factor unc-86 n=2 Tax=Caenorhabditis elegans TaxID=6239 RepID=UNC86_CAEEL|nr:Transcription factor unc-86 [Caenorhabditis elegans]P13528.2 RecName: Full=Transcription factor unc-86; AltName: Full=Uncoordinated protein 86 [Caenorhabditis elegans]CCD62656.1 Transcription factor unc-86 [Caenorhabditis elegans]|eukprot:NP_001021191.2 Transcription factor unc-86 [Caenorhabditis elegans]